MIGHLFGPGDLILHDSLSHNSILQGCDSLRSATPAVRPQRLGKRRTRSSTEYRHEYRRVLWWWSRVSTAWTATFPELPKFIELKKSPQRCNLMVDEAHSMGVLGAHADGAFRRALRRGSGATSTSGWARFRKSFGSCGGYIAGSKALVEYLEIYGTGIRLQRGAAPAERRRRRWPRSTCWRHEPQRVPTASSERSRLVPLELARRATESTPGRARIRPSCP